jgi:hypothetical protein
MKPMFSRKIILNSGGFSIAELAVVGLLFGLIILLTLDLIISHASSTSSLIKKQLSIDEWGRLDLLLETEIREANAVNLQSASVNACSTNFTPSIEIEPNLGSRKIYYYNRQVNGKSELRRCGPGVMSDGSIDADTDAIDALVLDNSTLYVETNSDGNLVTYSLDYNDSPAGSGTSRARVRVF